MTTPARSLRRLSSIQAGRAFAAILVVLYHNNTELFSVKKYWANTPIFPIFNFGHAGVEYFFVISGFIIFTVHHGDIGRASTAGAYVYKRIVRIYPVYWVVLFAVVIASFIFPYSRSIELSTFVSSFFLIATDTTDLAGMPNTIVLVAWTLYHEVM